MSDLHSINEAINAKAGRKLLPSILVGLSLIALVWLTLAYARVFFAVLVAIAVALGIREIARAFAAAGTQISMRSLVLATVGLTYATWSAGVEGLAIATAIALPVLLIFRLRKGPQDFVSEADYNTEVLIKDAIKVKSILGNQFALVPGLKSQDQITLLEEEKIMAYYGGGTLYATPERQEPLI